MSVFKKILIILAIFFISIIGISTILYFALEPSIKIEGKKEITMELNSSYKEEGYEANILGIDITDKVKIVNNVDYEKIGTYEIKYSVSHKLLKRKNEITRVVKIVDTINPEIKLSGGNISIYIGDKYKEPGYSAIDNYDGDITANVVVTNNIDNTKAGPYEVVYSVLDTSSNKTEVKRVVEVKTRPVNSTTKGYGVPVLMYHFFYDASKGQKGADSNWMEISDFEAQLKYLVDNDYYFPSWSELADYVDGKISLPKKSIVITADDGAQSFFDLAVPVINKYDVKVTSFIVTSWTGKGTINKYKSDKINFQTHTHDMHKGGCSGGHGGYFRCIPYEKGVSDLTNSTQIIGSADAIAYPFGDVTNNVLKVTKDVGIKLGFTTKYGKVYKGMDKLQLPRIRMSKGTSLTSFIKAISS